MNGTLASWLALLYMASEAALAFKKRARGGEAQLADRGSLGLVWAVIGISTFIGFNLAYSLPAARFGEAALPVMLALGVIFFIGGLALRWYAILYLGRFFTVNVAIASDHRVIDSGPYRYIRHPSYSGAIAAFLGLGLLLNNWASILVILIPTLGVFLWRMRIEEAALLAALGEAYRAYMGRTQRLIPALY